MKISKPTEPVKPVFPDPPKNLEEWIIKDSLLNKDDLPELYSTIIINGQIESIENHPEIIKGFDEYCENTWFINAERYWKAYNQYETLYTIYDRVNTLYKKLFTIYNKSQQFGEEYELILGVGLMHFKENEESPLLFRHILTVKSDISFEFSKFKSNIIIGQNIESDLSIETDAFIDLDEQFDSYDILEAEKIAKEMIQDKELSNPFDNNLHSVLQLLAERFKPGEGTYNQSLTYGVDITRKETVFFAPALILRKRDTRSFTSVFNQIITNIEQEDNPEIPILKELIEEPKEGVNFVQKMELSNSDESDQIIYFPKKYNDEQISIIREAGSHDKVLVQGPPGTGKSHTIVNLICHLLANNKKVLVTAYTARALEVLKDKLPIEFRELAVSLLSGDSSSIKGLEASINKINEHLSNTDLDVLEKEIFKLEKDLKLLRKDKRNDIDKLLLLKEKSSQTFTINSEYSGTLTQISESLESHKLKFDWYKDSFDDFNNNEVIDKIVSYYKEFKKYSQQDESIYNYKLPAIQNLFSIEEFQDYHDLNQTIKNENNTQYTFKYIETDDLKKLRSHLEILLNDYCKKVDSINVANKDEIVVELFKNQKKKWFNKIERSKSILNGLEKKKLRYKDQNCEVIYTTDKSLIALKNDAKILLDFLKKGNKFTGLKFKLNKNFFPNEIKERLYFIESIEVNGSICNTIGDYEKVLEDIHIRQSFEELYEIWSLDRLNKNYSANYEYFNDYLNQVEYLYNLITSSLVIVKSISSNSNIKINDLNTPAVKEYIKSVDFAIKQKKLVHYEKFKNIIIEDLSDAKYHPIGNELIEAINSLNYNRYNNLIQELQELHNQFISYSNYKNNKSELHLYFPNLINDISSNNITENNILSLKDVFKYKNAKNEVYRLLNDNNENELNLKIIEYDKKESKLIAQLSSSKAWFHVLGNLKQNSYLRRHLEAWVQAVKRIGKTGKGKRALKFRKIAQQEMEYCKAAIPCWIMPLYKVTETIKPEQELFDYVIVDEASQLGPDAILLLYISKNIIIVGDDKQTSPEYVGVDANAMTPYINKHLKGIPFKDFYGTEYSFFDHAKRFRGAELILREHFRCMPEIIEFSNKLFYAPDGKTLYPLKQYSEDRLQPLEHFYCLDGYSEGGGSNIQNKIEAQAIVDKIKEVVIDTRYNKKSIGVICLQGTAQSKLIESLLIKEIGETEYSKRKIICGNSASFQGDERDVMFLSLVTARNHKRSALTKQDDERRFNVAVSRAIEQVWLFHSILLDDLSNQNDLRYKILNHFTNYETPSLPYSNPIERTSGKQPEPFESWVEVDVYNDIVNKGYKVKPKYEVVKGKYNLDMAVYLPGGAKIGIECEDDNWLGRVKCLEHLQSLKVLERCGWQIFSIKGGEYYSDRGKSLELLWEICEQMSSFTTYETIGIVKEGEPILVKEVEEIEEADIEDNIENLYSVNFNPEHRFDSVIDQPEDEIIRYFNLFGTGNYVMSHDKLPRAEFSIPIKESQKHGFLLQCYNSGHVNKVKIPTLLSKRIDKEYMNGINLKDFVNKMIVIEKDEILGLTFYEKGVKLFKSHLTENIANRELLQLQGIKVIYNDFTKIDYHIIPIEEFENIDKLVFNSFTAKGKPMSNPYYQNEWLTVKKYQQIEESLDEITDTSVGDIIQEEETINFGKEVEVNKCITIHYPHNDKQMKVKLVEGHNGELKNINGVQIVNSLTPLGVSLLGRKLGETVQIGTSNTVVEIVNISD